MEGSSTAEGTRRFAERHIRNGQQKAAFRPLGSTGLTCSVLGFGCYRIEDRNPAHREALALALKQGCNLIDTSTNYADGHSETCVGEVLQSVRSEVPRSEVIVVSKVGYVQGENLALARSRERNGTPFPEMVKYMDGCWHCIHPVFIEDQLTRSLARLKLSRLDVYLLHNPEYFLMDARKGTKTADLQAARDEFYRRVENAFVYLEKEVRAGRINYYGVSSNTFGGDESAFDSTSLSRMWELSQAAARTVWGTTQSHFAVAQLPLNLFESGPYLTGNNHGQTVLEFANSKSLAVLVNRPLNAIVGNQLTRLADFPQTKVSGTLSDALKAALSLEESFQNGIADLVQVESGQVNPREFFRWAHEIRKADLGTLPRESWMQVEQEMILPQVSYLTEQLGRYFSATQHKERFDQWENAYLSSLERVLAHVRNLCNQNSHRLSDRISATIAPILPEAIRNETLSRKALAVLTNTPGVTCVLVGMRRPAYVLDALGVQSLPPFDVNPSVFNCFRHL